MKLFVLFSILSINSFAQNIDTKTTFPQLKTYKYDSNYIESFNSKLALRFVMPRRFEKFIIKDALSDKKHTYKANEHYGFGLGLTYKWLAFDITINPSFTQRNVKIYGNTKEFNLKGNIYLKRTLVEGYFRSYKGYYLANVHTIDSSWNSSMPFPQRSDIETIGWGVNYIIPFNWEQYTPKVTFLLDGRLKKSAGSFMSISSLYFYHLKTDSSLVDDFYSAESQINKLNIALLGQLFGYSYTYVNKDLYVTTGLFPGVTFPVGRISTNKGVSPPTFSANFKIMFRGGVGYNTKRWYTGLYFILDNNQTRLIDNISLINTLGEFRFFVGYRVIAPKLVDNVMKKIH